MVKARRLVQGKGLQSFCTRLTSLSLPSEGAGALARRNESSDPAVCLARPTHAYEIFPRIAGRLAPVADGTFDGLPIPGLERHERKRRSFLGLRRKSEFVGRSNFHLQRPEFVSQHGQQGRIVGSAAGNNVLAKFFPLGRTTKRRRALAIERAVRAVAVATMSCFGARPQRFMNC